MRAGAIAMGALLMAGAALAEPPKRDVSKPAAEQQQRPAVVLASADPVRAPAPPAQQPVSAPAKRAAPRVTTCRCGDPQVGGDTPDQ